MANILMVDDSRTSRRILRQILEQEGHTVVEEAVNGEDGVRKFQQHRPDMVTMDITMPVLDGIEALKMIKALKSDSKVIMVSAAGQKSKILECLKAGADEFITKPFQQNEIVEAVKRIVGKDSSISAV